MNPIKRWYRWKLSGIITVGLGAILLYGGVLYIDAQGEFFDPWSCETIKKYMLDTNVPSGMVSHNDITEEQHLKLHIIYQECMDDTEFAEPIDHLHPFNP